MFFVSYGIVLDGVSLWMSIKSQCTTQEVCVCVHLCVRIPLLLHDETELGI